MTRDDFIRQNPLLDVLEVKGVKVIGGGDQRMAKCPFHQDKTASMSIKVSEGVWNCHAGCGGGSVIDFLMKIEGKTFVQVVGTNGGKASTFVKCQPPPKKEEAPTQDYKLTKVYSYQNEIGDEIFQVCRYEPKTFKQRRPDGKGGYLWGMDGVERKLYRLPEIIKATQVAIVEGEKDADNLARCGFTATCNVGGGGKWLDSYSDALADKDVIICGDNDKTGQEHVRKVFDSVSPKAKTVRIITIPAPHKDVSDLILQYEDTKEPAKQIQALIDAATPHVKGQKLPLFTMRELEPLYVSMAQDLTKTTLSLSKWIPSLKYLRPLVPGELVLLIGDTGTGKTAWLQNLAFKTLPLPVVFFEMELPPQLIFERFVSIATKVNCRDVEDSYSKLDFVGPDALEYHFRNLYICTEAKLNLQSLEDYINRAELKIGRRPQVVFLDYVQLMAGMGKRYERTSDAAEGLKVIAKATRTIFVVASQIQRPSKDNKTLGLHSGKDSGALENSAGVVIGISRDSQDKELLKLTVLKSTKGGSGLKVDLNYFGENMQINERFLTP